MADLATLQARLAEAEEAYHLLMTGAKEVSVSIGGYGSTTYTQVNIEKLDQYIQRLGAQIARLGGKSRRGVILTEF
jgi:hypothetical protein